jgi:integrase/recombinase XerC
MPGMPVTTLTLETIEAFRQWCIGRGRSANTVRGYSADLRTFLKAAGMNGEVKKDEYEELAQSWLNLTRAQAAPKTTARRMTSLKNFARWAKWSSVLDEYIAPKPGKTIPHPIAEGMEGVMRMLAHTKNCEQEALVAAGAFCGLRIAESLSIRTHDFDIPSMLLTVRGKGDKTRVVPLSHTAWEHLAPAYVYAMTREGHHLVRYKDRFARQVITNLAKRAALRAEVSSHDLRATFATAALDRTNNIRVVQELLGHASSETTEIYTAVDQSARGCGLMWCDLSERLWIVTDGTCAKSKSNESTMARVDNDAWIVLACDPDTASWTVVANCSIAKMGKDEAESRARQTYLEVRQESTNPALLLFTGDFPQFV